MGDFDQATRRQEWEAKRYGYLMQQDARHRGDLESLERERKRFSTVSSKQVSINSH